MNILSKDMIHYICQYMHKLDVCNWSETCKYVNAKLRLYIDKNYYY